MYTITPAQALLVLKLISYYVAGFDETTKSINVKDVEDLTDNLKAQKRMRDREGR